MQWVKCERCKSQIPHWIGDPKPTLCKKCKIFDHYDEDKDHACPHDKLVRCPRCLTFINVYPDKWIDLLEEGKHDVFCDECETLFVIETEIRYVYWSPMREGEKRS